MDQTTDPQISQITQIKIQFWNLRNLRNLRMGSVPPCGMVRVHLRPINRRALRKTASSIRGVSLPVKVFCWLG